MFTRVLPPPEVQFRAFSAEAVTINVTFTGFTAEAQAAFQYAVDIWQSQLTSTVPIRVNAVFTVLGPGVLGSAGAAALWRDFTGATFPGTWYAQALVNKLYGSEIHPGSVDINASFNSSFTWYYGTDGNTPAGQYDFVSVVLHELTHGLGFSGTMSVSGGLGSWGLGSGYPGIYDRFVENGSAQSLLNTTLFQNYSPALAAQLTSGSLYWNGTNGVSANSGVRPRIYAPGTWSQGSSYSHLDESTYPAGNANSLMTYAIGAAEAIHDPGPIVRGMFTDTGWTTSTSCSYAITPTNATVAASGGAGIVTVTADSGCAWTAVTSAAWIVVTSGSGGTGNGTVSYSVAANSGVPRSGAITIEGQTFTVNQQSSLPTLALSPASLRYGAVNTGAGTLSAATPGQAVTVTQTGGGTVAWTATGNQPWIQVTSGSGTGTGTFTVGVVSSVLPPTGTVTGTVTVAAAGAQNSPTLTVYLTLYGTGGTTAAFGQVDTPVQDTTGVQGAIGVTGWALDDVGVSDVQIYRTCLTFDNPLACQVVGGVNVVYVGTAAFLAGARPDVEAAFPSYPQGYRGGWGFLLLTNMLPDVTNSQPYGGQGSLTLYVFATDEEGHRTLVGRSQVDHTPTTIAMANATIAKPFGAIDTPGQGQTVSGTLANFGWALTPDADGVAGNGDIEIPTNGSTMVVFLDGVATAAIGYNQCRGTVGTPPPAGEYCDDDVANIFGNPTPQPTFTPRTANATKHRNLDAGRGAIGYFDIDTTALANGLHTIAWSVTDSASRVEGIGSRFFTVLNGSSDAATARALADAPARVVGRADALTWRAVARGAVWGRGGFDLRAPWQTVEPVPGGVRHARLPEMGRLELYLGAGVREGYLRAGETLRPLPAGSRLADGHFTWVPGPAYVGDYTLVFERDGAQIPVTVTIEAASEPRVEAEIDAPRPGRPVRGAFLVTGWAAEPTVWAGTGIGAVHVWAHRRDVAGVPPVFLGAAELGGWRPDVGVRLGAQFERAGWQLTAPALPPGDYDVIAYFWSLRTGRFEDARGVRVNVR